MKNITIIILGATGDLAKKKLIPAMTALTARHVIEKINIVAIGRKPLNDSKYSQIVGFRKSASVSMHYLRADFEQKDSLTDLGPLLKTIEDAETIGRIFYLATSPKYFNELVKRLSACCTDKKKFNRIMIEKPFGYDLKSSKQLNSYLEKYFDEKDIFRVDHYLAKETVQNILVLRFSNPFFERSWNSDFIASITITVSEDIGVGERIGYYDGSGAIRDMMQNHLLQMLSFILMDTPKTIEANSIHEAKASAIKKLSCKKISVGQYEEYLDEIKKFGKDKSDTETFARLELKSSAKRWRNTAIYLQSGKNLASKYANIEINYKKEPCTLYCNTDTSANKLILHIQPSQDIAFEMNTLTPSSMDMDIKHVKMNFCRDCEFESNSPESYEVILAECIKGEKTLFISEQELYAAWSLVDKIRSKMPKPSIYKKGLHISEVGISK